MRAVPIILALCASIVFSGPANAGIEEQVRERMCLAKDAYQYDAGDPSALSPFARSVYRASKLSVDQFAGIAGGAADPERKQAYLDWLRNRLEGHMSSTEQVMRQMAKFRRHDFRGVSDTSFADGVDYDTGDFLWHQGPGNAPGTVVTALTWVVETGGKAESEKLVKQAATELGGVLPKADCWKYQDKQFLIERRRGWAEQQRRAGNERMAKKQERDLENLRESGQLDLIRIQYQWAPEGYMSDPASAARKQRIQVIEMTYFDDDVHVLVRDFRPGEQ